MGALSTLASKISAFKRTSGPLRHEPANKAAARSSGRVMGSSLSLRHALLKLTIGLVMVLVTVYDILTIVFYFLWQQPWKKWPLYCRLRSEPDPLYEKEANSFVRRSVKTVPEHFLQKCKTIDEAFDRAYEHHGPNAVCVGYRQVISSESVIIDGKPVNKCELTDYKWLTFEQFYQNINCFGHGLHQLGIRKGDKVMIFAETCANWLICGQSIIKNGSVLVTLYSTLGDQGIVHGIKETEVQYIITSYILAQKLARLQGELGPLKQIIVLDCSDCEQMTKLQEEFDSTDVQVSSFTSIVDSGDETFYKKNKVAIDENDIAIIMYTSGSGGIPKGVMISHRNFLVGSWSVLSLVHFFIDEMPRHTYIGYLPLAHILEFATETFLVLVGARIGYSSPHTITDLSVGLKEGTRGDASLLQPTLMASVPLVLDRIRKAIYASLNSKGLLAVRLFEYVIEYKTFWQSKGFETPIIDALFLSKFRSIVGGKLEMLMTGGAPLSSDTQKFIRACLNVTFAQGYGATETVCSGLFMDENDHTLAKVGGPLYGVKVKLVDWSEGGYLTRDAPNPRGEIHLSSESISVGYYKLEKLTSEAYYWQCGERWFKTGDIGELDSKSGCFKIIDRKKDFIKLQFGEYISLGKIETKLKTSYLVNNVCVVGNSLYNYVIAIAIPNPKVIQKMASKCGLDPEAAYNNPKVTQRMLDKLTRFARSNGLRRYEIPRGLILVKVDWTPESNLITSSFKLKRKNIEQHYSEAIRETFSKLE